MDSFPAEFSQGIRPTEPIPTIRGDTDRLRWLPGLLKPALRSFALQALEETIAPYLKPVYSPVHAKTISGMTRNYSEMLPKSLHNTSVMLDQSRSAAAKGARSIGLTDFLNSKSLREFAETVSGYRLEPDPGLQVIRYSPGDYVGPHNDHHPEEDYLRDGYVDLQITISNDDVERQYLIYEKGGYFNQMINVGVASGVSVSFLPFWHQVTPLQAKPSKEQTARRWLLLASFFVQPDEFASKPRRPR